MRICRRLLSALLALVMLLSLGVAALAEELAVPAEEPPAERYSYYPNYVAIGDSVGSGFGLPDYNREGKLVIDCRRVTDSYPDLVGDAVGAKNVSQFHLCGARTADLRYMMDENYAADWVLLGQAAYLSEGVISKEHLDELRPKVQDAIRNADLITLDCGLNDCWLPVMAAIYDIADEGRLFGRGLTIPERVQREGSLLAVMDNAASFLNAWAANPLRWPAYLFKLMVSLQKWVFDYQINIRAMIAKIFLLNPHATLVVCGMYNPVENWGVFPLLHDQLIERVLQPYYDMLNLAKRTAVALYPGEAVFIDMKGVELVSDSFTIPLFEMVTLNDRGYNPHPTPAGCRDQARRILNTLSVPQTDRVIG